MFAVSIELAIAEALQVHPGEVNELVFGLALTSLGGNAVSTRINGGVRPKLTIVS